LRDLLLAKLSGAAAAVAVIAAAAVSVLCQLIKEGYFTRRRARKRGEVPPSPFAGPPQTLNRQHRRSLIVQALLLAVVFSTVIAVTTFYWAPASFFRSRLVAGAWGLFIGIPAAAALVLRMDNGSTDD
jgi:hypothetical protein